MKKRLLFIIVYLLWMPMGLVAIFWSIAGMVFVAPIVWIVTGNEERAFRCGFEGKVPSWIIDFPYKILGENKM